MSVELNILFLVYYSFGYNDHYLFKTFRLIFDILSTTALILSSSFFPWELLMKYIQCPVLHVINVTKENLNLLLLDKKTTTYKRLISNVVYI